MTRSWLMKIIGPTCIVAAFLIARGADAQVLLYNAFHGPSNQIKVRGDINTEIRSTYPVSGGRSLTDYGSQQSGSYATVSPSSYISNATGTADAHLTCSAWRNRQVVQSSNPLIYLRATADATATSNGSDVYVRWAIWDSYVSGQYEVIANPNVPSAGADWNSATLTARYYVLPGADFTGTQSEMDGGYSGISLAIGASPGDSYLSVGPLDAAGATWGAYGYLTQGTSSNPSAAGVYVSDSFLAWDEIIYYPTKASGVGDWLYLDASMGIVQWLLPSGVDNSDYYAEVRYSVLAP